MYEMVCGGGGLLSDAWWVWIILLLLYCDIGSRQWHLFIVPHTHIHTHTDTKVCAVAFVRT